MPDMRELDLSIEELREGDEVTVRGVVKSIGPFDVFARVKEGGRSEVCCLPRSAIVSARRPEPPLKVGDRVKYDKYIEQYEIRGFSTNGRDAAIEGMDSSNNMWAPLHRLTRLPSNGGEG